MTRLRLYIGVMIILAFVAGNSYAAIMTSAGYSLDKDVVSAGDSKPTSSGYNVKQTIGQFSASFMTSSGYDLKSGFGIGGEVGAADALTTRAASSWYQGDKAVERFNFTSVLLGSESIYYYRYKWDRAAATGVTGSDTQWASGTLPLAPVSSNKLYLHVIPYSDEGDIGIQVNYGPYYFVETQRLLKHKKFFDEDGMLIQLP